MQLVNWFVTLFVVIDPIGLLPVFSALTHHATRREREKMAVKAVVLSAAILYFFAIAGDRLLHAMGADLPAMRIAGGLLLLLLAIDMVFAMHSGLRSTTRTENEEASHRADISVFPLAFPLIAGPGGITTVLLLSVSHRGVFMEFAGLLLMLAAVLLATLIALLLTSRLVPLLGETGSNVITRIFGVLLATLAAQYIIDGVQQVLRPT